MQIQCQHEILIFGHVYGIVKEYSMRKDKVNFYINYGIAPVFRDEILLACVKWTLHYVLFDGSFCHMFRDNQLDAY